MHETYMQRCLELAAKGIRKAAPNPLVGSVIVHQNRIIGEGYHQLYGTGHGEYNAIQSVAESDRHLLPKSTLYVNLEPCAHHGKTPPCADLIVEHKIPKVVIGCLDTNPKVAGKGVSKMEAAGIEVISGISEEEAWFLNRRFFTWMQHRRPYIILKWAQTADGYFAPQGNEQRWISNSLSKRLAHKWRAEEQAILIGRMTAAIDNPRLTVRKWKGENPVRMVIDKNGMLPPHLNLFNDEAPTIVFTELDKTDLVTTQFVKLNFSENILPQMLESLYQRNIQSVLVEGGATLINSFIEQNLWDEARIFTAPQRWGTGIVAPRLTHEQLLSEEAIGNNTLSVFLNENRVKL